VFLPAIIVEDMRTCKAPSDAGLAASLWEEARKALGAVAWTEGKALSAERTDQEAQRDSVLVEATTDAAGYYSICGVPAGVTLTAQATLRAGASVETRVVVQEGAVIRLDFTSN
jgi:hypothetical protein